MHPTRPLRSRCCVVAIATCLTLTAALATPLAAQATRTTLLDYATGGEFEDYLRALQVAGLTDLYPWSIRGFSPREIQRLAAADTAGPWRLAAGLKIGSAAVGPITLRAAFNSAYPYGANDGAVWAGRGITTALSGGVAARLGAFSLTLAPIAFSASNGSFSLHPNGKTGARAFANALAPGSVDAPQRFGPGSYSRLDPGASAIRFDSKLVTFGVSTANEWIGPATEYPFLLGTNAPGFPHLFVGTGEPLNLWLARVHSRVAWGKLYQSEYSPVTGPERYTSREASGTVRLATYAVVSIMPRGIRGLELGFARFIHVPYRVGEPGADFWKKPFKVIFLENEYARGDSAGTDNQLATAFFRWVFPRSGFELFGERSYEDHFYDRRDLVLRPDHERSYTLGFQKILRRRPATLDVLKGELINYQYPTTVYLHGQLRQGHTNRGQLLGAGAGVPGGSASVLSWTRYGASDRTALTLRRIVRAQRGEPVQTFTAGSQNTDVIVSAGLERMRLGKRMDFGLKLEVMQNFYRNFSDDEPNLNLQLMARLKDW
ncbi:MAG: hypothetical protein ABIV11_03035 [Gemmatimonadaceae bacterium]